MFDPVSFIRGHTGIGRVGADPRRGYLLGVSKKL
jgi:hypothetical protein